MKFFARIIFVPVAVIIVLFAVANRQAVKLDFWPLPFEADPPLYLVLLGALAIGVLLGTGISAFTVGKWRMRARASERRARESAVRRQTVTDIPARREITLSASTVPAIDAPRRRAALDDD